MSHDFCHLHQIKRLMISSGDFGGTIHKSNGSDLTTSTLSHSQYRPSISGAIKALLINNRSRGVASCDHMTNDRCGLLQVPSSARENPDQRWHTCARTTHAYILCCCALCTHFQTDQLHTVIYEFKTRRFTNTHFHTNSLCRQYKGRELLARVGRVWKSAPYQHRTDSDCSDTDTSDPSCHQPPPKRLCVCDWKFSLRHASA